MARDDRRYTIYPGPDVLTTLGIDLDADDQGAAPQTHDTLRAWAAVVARATADNAQAFGRAEWNYLADCLNGCMDLWQLSGVNPTTLLWAEAEDAHKLNRLGDKWLDAESRKNADKLAAALVGKLRDLDTAHAYAVMIAVRHFWRHPDVDHSADEWWTLAHRKTPPADEPAKKGG